MFSAADIAWFFVEKGAGDPSMTQLKVQKLTYYAQGYALGLLGRPLFEDDIKAWKHGPVSPSLRFLQDCGDQPISLDQPFGEPINDPEAKAILDSVWRVYGKFSANTLICMCHAEPTWEDAYQKGENTEITREAMRSYFSSRSGDLDLEGEDDPIATVFLKGGKTAQVPLSLVDEYLETHADELAANSAPT